MSYATISLIGRLVNEPVVREGKDQRKFVTFRLAVNNQFGATEHAAFYNCTGNEYMANRINKAGLTKGRLIKEGEIRMSLDVGIYDWAYIGGKPKNEDGSEPAQQNQNATGTVHPESTIGDEDDLPL